MPVTLRPVVDSDKDFLFEVYASTRREEIAAWGWDHVQQDAFLRMQFMAKQRGEDTKSETASHSIILLEDEPIGRLLVNKSSEEICLSDIALLPTTRGKGIGTALIKDLLDEGKKSNRPVRLQVLQVNPAARLYERLGFVVTERIDPYFQMEKLPGGRRVALRGV